MPLYEFDKKIKSDEIIFYEQKESGLKTGYLVSELLQSIAEKKTLLLEIGSTNRDFEFLKRNNLLNKPNILLIFIKNSNKNQTLQQIINRKRAGQEAVTQKIEKNRIAEQETLVENNSIVIINESEKQDKCVKKIADIIENFLLNQLEHEEEAKFDSSCQELQLEF